MFLFPLQIGLRIVREREQLRSASDPRAIGQAVGHYFAVHLWRNYNLWIDIMGECSNSSTNLNHNITTSKLELFTCHQKTPLEIAVEIDRYMKTTGFLLYSEGHNTIPSLPVEEMKPMIAIDIDDTISMVVIYPTLLL